MNINKVSTIEAIALILILTINRLSISLPQDIILSCGSSSILNVIYISIIAIIFTIIIVKLFKRFAGSDIVDVSSFLGGKVLRNIVGIFLILYIISISSLLLRYFSETLKVLYYFDTPVIYILLFFIGVCIIANIFGGYSIIKTNLIVCIIMLVGLIISFLSVTPNMTIQRALPILGYGADKTFFYGLTNLIAFNGLLILYLVPPMLSNKKDFKKVAIISIIITAILIVFAVGSILLAFSFSTEIDKISSLYMLLSNNVFGKYLQHPESLFSFTWVLSFMSYINIACMLCIQLVKKVTNIKNGKPLIIPISLIIFALALLPKNLVYAHQIEYSLYTFVSIPLLFIILPAILIFANRKYKKIHRNNYDV